MSDKTNDGKTKCIFCTKHPACGLYRSIEDAIKSWTYLFVRNSDWLGICDAPAKHCRLFEYNKTNDR